MKELLKKILDELFKNPTPGYLEGEKLYPPNSPRPKPAPRSLKCK